MLSRFCRSSVARLTRSTRHPRRFTLYLEESSVGPAIASLIQPPIFASSFTRSFLTSRVLLLPKARLDFSKNPTSLATSNQEPEGFSDDEVQDSLTEVARIPPEIARLNKQLEREDPAAIAHVELAAKEFFEQFMNHYHQTLNPVDESKQRLEALPLEPEKFFKTRPETPDNYALLIRAHVQQGQAAEAFELVKRMEKNGIQPDILVYTALLSACRATQNVPKAFAIVEEMKEKKIQRDYHIYGALTHVCTSSGDIDRGFHALELMKQDKLTPNEVVYNTLFHGCLKTHQIGRAWLTWDEMRTNGIEPDEIAYNTAIRVAAQRSNFDLARTFLSEMRVNGMPLSLYTYNTLIYAAAKRKESYVEAFQLYDDAVVTGIVPDSHMLHSLLYACSRNGDLPNAKKIISHFDKFGVPKTQLTFNTMLATIAQSFVEHDQLVMDGVKITKNARIELAEDMLTEMQKLGIAVDTVTVNSLLNCYTRGILVQRAEDFVAKRFQQYGVVPDSFTYLALFRMYAKARREDQASALFDKMKAEGFRLIPEMYRSLIHLYGYRQDLKKSHQYIDEMRAQGFNVTRRDLRLARGQFGLYKLKEYGLDMEKYLPPKSPFMHNPLEVHQGHKREEELRYERDSTIMENEKKLEVAEKLLGEKLPRGKKWAPLY